MSLEPQPLSDVDVVDCVVLHPRVVELGRTWQEQQRVNAFAKDIARWLYGQPRAELGALARVVTAVARKELRDPRRLCRGRPLMAVEAGARATEAMWPLLRGDLEDPDAPPPEPEPTPGEEGEEGGDEGEDESLGAPSGDGDGEEDEDGEGEGDEGEGEGEDGEGEGEGDASASGDGDADGDGDGSGQGSQPGSMGEGMDPMDVLKQLAEMDELADPELDAFADRLREAMGGDEGDAVDIGSAAADMLGDVGDTVVDAAMKTDRMARALEQFLPGIGWSTAPTQVQLTLLERLEQLVDLLEQLDELKELADALGRLEEATRRAGRQEGGREEVVGVRLGGDVSTALPSELGLLGDPSTEDLFYQRFTEHRLVSLELSGRGDEGVAQGDKRGPVIACIDTSASMEGAPEMAAKALVLAICRRALPRGRTVHLLLFGGPGEQTELRLRRGLGGLEGLLDFLALSFSSGTDFDGPLVRATELLEERELDLADILVVTDGLCRASPDVIRRVDEVRESRGARVWSVVLGARSVAGVEPFSDEVWQLDPDDAAQSVGLVRRFR